jgi:hypothetical protein
MSFPTKYDTATNTHVRVKPKSPAKPNSNAPVGQGGRFAALKQKIGQEPGVNDPGAVAASIGRKKYGNAGFNKLSQQGS